VREVPRLAADLHRQIDAMVAMARECEAAVAAAGSAQAARDESLRACLRQGMRELLRSESRRQRWRVDDEALMRVFALDVGLNADGLAAWLASVADAPGEARGKPASAS
jgi:hydroxyacylglutathione hydrolase